MHASKSCFFGTGIWHGQGCPAEGCTYVALKRPEGRLCRRLRRSTRMLPDPRHDVLLDTEVGHVQMPQQGSQWHWPEGAQGICSRNLRLELLYSWPSFGNSTGLKSDLKKTSSFKQLIGRPNHVFSALSAQNLDSFRVRDSSCVSRRRQAHEMTVLREKVEFGD